MVIDAEPCGEFRFQRVGQRAMADIMEQTRRDQQVALRHIGPGQIAVFLRQQRHAQRMIIARMAFIGRAAIGVE